MQASTMSAGPASQALEIGRNTRAVVILGRSKERSDAAQTLGSMDDTATAARKVLRKKAVI